MKKILYIIFFISAFLLINNTSFAESKDCSQYSTKTLSGLSDHLRCKKGLPPKKNFFESLKLKKTNTDKTSEKNLACDDYTTKTIAGLWGKFKCRKN